MRRPSQSETTGSTTVQQRPSTGISCCRSWSRTFASTGSGCVHEWASRIHDAHLLETMTPQEMAAETTSVYDNYVEVLETGSVEALQHYAKDLSERIIPRGVETHEVIGIVLLLRDVLARSLFEKYQRDLPLLNQVLDAYEPAANRIANTVAVSFVRGAREGHPPAAGRDPRAVDAGAAGARAPAHPADHRRPRQRACQAAHRAAAPRHPHPSGQGRRHRHHRRTRRRPDGGQPPGPDGRRISAHGRQRHHHRSVTRRSPRRS